MAKKVLTLIKLQIPGGQANPAPPVGPALGQHGVNIVEFTKAFNAQTAHENGRIIPVEITVFEDRSFTFITKTPPAAVLIKEALGIEKGSGEPNMNKVGKLTQAQVRSIAETKMPDLNANDVEAAMLVIAGTARAWAWRWKRDLPPTRPEGAAWGFRAAAARCRGRASRWKRERTASGMRPRARRSTARSCTRPPRRSGSSRQFPGAKFDETVEAHFRLGLNVRHADEQLRGTIMLPHGIGKDVRVAVFAEGDKAREAEEAGADVIGSADLAAKIEGGFLDFDVAIATPDQMGNVGKLGRVLGPRGLMPNPKTGTVTFDIAQGRERRQGGQAGVPHRPRCQRAPADREEELRRAASCSRTTRRSWRRSCGPSRRPPRAVTSRASRVTTTMGPGLRVDPTRTRDIVAESADADSAREAATV